MLGLSVPNELLLLALVGLAGFGLGWFLRRRQRPKEREIIESVALERGPTAIVSVALADALKVSAGEPVAQETVATLAAASQAILEMQLLPTCPRCGARMELRVFNEKKIWVCDDFPGCRGARMADQ